MCRHSRRSIRFLVLCMCASISLTTGCATPGSASEPDERSVRDFAGQFLRAFENLDMPPFIDCFADDATAFFPEPEPPLRFEGKAAIQAQFKKVFAAIRGGAAGGPPFHTLRPQNMTVQFVSGESAIVTFHLRGEKRIARRSLVLRKTGAGWRIVHLHASNVVVDEQR